MIYSKDRRYSKEIIPEVLLSLLDRLRRKSQRAYYLPLDTLRRKSQRAYYLPLDTFLSLCNNICTIIQLFLRMSLLNRIHLPIRLLSIYVILLCDFVYVCIFISSALWCLMKIYFHFICFMVLNKNAFSFHPLRDTSKCVVI